MVLVVLRNKEDGEVVLHYYDIACAAIEGLSEEKWEIKSGRNNTAAAWSARA